jgi:uncharacterized protein (TIGR02246 family)
VQAKVPPPSEKATPNAAPLTVKAHVAETPEAGIKKITEEYVKAFNAGDAKAAASLWTTEGEYIGVNGEPILGRAAIEKSLMEEFKAHPKATVEVRVESIRIIGRQTAMAESIVKLKIPGDAEVSETRYSALHVFEDGQWSVASVREWLPDPGLAAAMKHLDWLVGEWTAKGEVGNIALSYVWDENKTFLHGKYSITKDGKTVSTGIQMIARNLSGGLRSWMFDSSGTFNDALWEHDENRWIEHTTGVLPDGIEIHSVNILILLGLDAFTWQPTERTADGVAISPLPPIKVTRVKPRK